MTPNNDGPAAIKALTELGYTGTVTPMSNRGTAKDTDTTDLPIAGLDIYTRGALHAVSGLVTQHDADAKRLDAEAAQARARRNEGLRSLRASGLSVRQIAAATGMGADNIKAILR